MERISALWDTDRIEPRGWGSGVDSTSLNVAFHWNGFSHAALAKPFVSASEPVTSGGSSPTSHQNSGPPAVPSFLGCPMPSPKMPTSTEAGSLLASPALSGKEAPARVPPVGDAGIPPTPAPSCHAGIHHLKHCTVPQAQQSCRSGPLEERSGPTASSFWAQVIWVLFFCYNQNDLEVMGISAFPLINMLVDSQTTVITHTCLLCTEQNRTQKDLYVNASLPRNWLTV